jgi:uncharacterized radical SAM superfamily protein
MDMISVTSSNLESVGYEESSQTLQIRFLSGGMYEYFDVPSPIYEGLLDSSSKGRYFHQYIKNNYRFNRL